MIYSWGMIGPVSCWLISAGSGMVVAWPVRWRQRWFHPLVIGDGWV